MGVPSLTILSIPFENEKHIRARGAEKHSKARFVLVYQQASGYCY
jgi:hypothetical protein